MTSRKKKPDTILFDIIQRLETTAKARDWAVETSRIVDSVTHEFAFESVDRDFHLDFANDDDSFDDLATHLHWSPDAIDDEGIIIEHAVATFGANVVADITIITPPYNDQGADARLSVILKRTTATRLLQEVTELCRKYGTSAGRNLERFSEQRPVEALSVISEIIATIKPRLQTEGHGANLELVSFLQNLSTEVQQWEREATGEHIRWGFPLPITRLSWESDSEYNDQGGSYLVLNRANITLTLPDKTNIDIGVNSNEEFDLEDLSQESLSALTGMAVTDQNRSRAIERLEASILVDPQTIRDYIWMKVHAENTTGSNSVEWDYPSVKTQAA